MPEHSRRRRGRFRGHGAAIGAGLAAVAVIVVAVLLFRDGDTQPTRKIPEIRMVTLQPPPPPPPPPQPPPPPKMVEQTPMKEPEIKQEKPLDKPKEAPPPGPLGLDAKGEGPGDAFNLAGRPGGNALLSGSGGGGSRWGWYASIVQTQIEQALRENQRTRNAVLRVDVRLWADATGRINRVQLLSSTGNASIDDAIRNEVLAGMPLREPPPKDMPMPIIVRLTERQAG